ncbi:MAG: mechanosensitive ion channel family protein [Lachnospiraceae bacterium]
MEAIRDYFMSFKPWTSLLIVVLSIVLWKKITDFIKHRAVRETNSKRTGNIQLGLNIIKYIVIIFVAITVLQINDVNVTSFVTSLGLAGVTIGFALQDFLKDIIMGISIRWENFFTVGDEVRFEEYEGTVVRFDLKTTKIQDVNTGNIVAICNREISKVQIISEWFMVAVPAAYEEDVDRIRNIMREICTEAEKIGNVKKCIFVGTGNFEASYVEYKIKVICVNVAARVQTRRDVLGVIQDVYARNNINFPYPHTDVSMVK